MYKPNTKELTYDSLYIVIFDIDAAWVLALDFQGTVNHTFCDLQQSPIIIQTLNRRTGKISRSRVNHLVKDKNIMINPCMDSSSK